MNLDNYSYVIAVTTDTDFCLIGTPNPAVLDLVTNLSDDYRGLYRVLLIASDTKSRENYLNAIESVVSAKIDRPLYRNISEDHDMFYGFQQHVIINSQNECVREINSIVEGNYSIHPFFSNDEPSSFIYNLIIVQNPGGRFLQIESDIYQEAEYNHKEIDSFVHKNSEIKQWVKENWSQAKLEETEEMCKYLNNMMQEVGLNGRH